MFRKFLLAHHRKNECRKHRQSQSQMVCPLSVERESEESHAASLAESMPISIPLSMVSVLTIAIDFNIYRDTPFSSLQQLRSRLPPSPSLFLLRVRMIFFPFNVCSSLLCISSSGFSWHHLNKKLAVSREFIFAAEGTWKLSSSTSHCTTLSPYYFARVSRAPPRAPHQPQ